MDWPRLSTRLQPNASDCWHHYGGSLLHATEAYVAMLTRCLVTKTITELCDGYLADCTARLKRHEIGARNLETMTESASKLKTQFGNVLICNLQGREVKEWLSTLTLAPRTRNKHLGSIKQMGTSVELVDQHYREVAFHDDAVSYFNLHPPPTPLLCVRRCDYYQADMR